jgi:hypothetical protein
MITQQEAERMALAIAASGDWFFSLVPGAADDDRRIVEEVNDLIQKGLTHIARQQTESDKQAAVADYRLMLAKLLYVCTAADIIAQACFIVEGGLNARKRNIPPTQPRRGRD